MSIIDFSDYDYNVQQEIRLLVEHCNSRFINGDIVVFDEQIINKENLARLEWLGITIKESK